MLHRFAFALLLPLVAWTASHRVLIRTTDGRMIEGDTARASIGTGSTAIRLERVLSIHNGAPASDSEKGRIEAGLAAVQGSDRKARDLAVEELTAIGLPRHDATVEVLQRHRPT